VRGFDIRLRKDVSHCHSVSHWQLVKELLDEEKNDFWLEEETALA